MKIVFIGNVDFSRHCLECVLKNQGEVVGIVTAASAGINSDYCDLTGIAKKYRIPIHYCGDINAPRTVDWIRNKKPDILFCWGWSQIIREPLLGLTRRGIVGTHPTLLPQNRGRHPLIWALILGLKKTGLTFFFLDKKADSGPILSQKSFVITKQDNAGTLYQKMKAAATIQIKAFLPKLAAGKEQRKPQDKNKATYWRKRIREDGLIDWRMSGEAILNLVRALTRPYPGAEFRHRGNTVTVWAAKEYTKHVASNIEPGKVIAVVRGKPVVKCHDKAIFISDYAPKKIRFVPGEYLL